MDPSGIKSFLIQPLVQTDSLKNSPSVANSFAAPSLEINDSVPDNVVSASTEPILKDTVPGSVILIVNDPSTETEVVSLDTTLNVVESSFIVKEEPLLNNSNDGKISFPAPLISRQTQVIPLGSAGDETKQVKLTIFFIFFILSIPLIVCNFYFAITDNTCVHQTTSDFKLPYSTILIVDAVLSILFLLGIVVISDQCITMLLLIVYQIFVLIWTIIACIVFFSFMAVGKDCSRPVYTYILTTLILKLIGQFNLLCQNSKKD
jgi:hypothetical protein